MTVIRHDTRNTRAGACVRWGTTVTCKRYKFALTIVSLLLGPLRDESQIELNRPMKGVSFWKIELR